MRLLYSMRAAAVAALFSGLLLVHAGSVQAHPHVWVTVSSSVVYEGGKITGLKHKWTFDDMYTAMAIEGLDTNGDKAYSREELADLAKVNIDGLKEFGYFTHAKLGSKALKLKDPVDYWLEYKDGQLSLFLTLPLEESVLADADGFNFAVADESFFIAFDFAKDNPVVLGDGAPQGCVASLAVPEKDLQQLQDLNKAFGGQLTAGDANAGTGMGYSQTATVTCKRS